MNLKKACAKAAMEYIANGMVIGLGGGSTIGYLIDFIKQENLEIKIVTPSLKTALNCLDQGLTVLPTQSVDEIDVAFDGCDQVDEKLHALKSGGGIHTQEKLIAQMAKEYILLVDETKFVPVLTYKHPVVLEILPQSLRYVIKQAQSIGESVEVQTGLNKDGYTVSDNGNFLLAVYFQDVQNSGYLEDQLKKIAGVIDVSIFTTVVTKALIAGKDGIRKIEKQTKR